MSIDDAVQQRIAEAARRREASKERRAALQAARNAGLVQRHRGKLARLDAAEIASVRANGSYALSAAEPIGRAAERAPEGRDFQPPAAA
jgi:hypothetical protein